MAATLRPPIVAVMGHIDHGKSSLLDYIRKTNVVEGEAGGITQHVAAYEAVHEHEGKERTLTFLDTPGHEAFRALRARGAVAADIAILVIAAEEGVKPQTLEAYKAAEDAGTPVVVAFTKIDKPEADIERAKISATENGIYLEGLGGSIPFAGVSSKNGEGVPELLDLVLLTADLAELSADPDAQPEGFVLESSQDPKQGMAATLIVKQGTLSTGCVVVAGNAYAPVRFIENFAGVRIDAAGPSMPARIAGWNALPPSGTPFQIVKNKKEAEKLMRDDAPSKEVGAPTDAHADTATLPLILKADVTGSIEAIKHEIAKIEHERVVVKILSEGVGSVSETDVKSAQVGNAVIIGFNVSTDAAAHDLSERTSVLIESFSIIYELAKRIDELVKERAPRIEVEEVLGEAKVLKVFSVAGTKHVLGARWISGTLSVGDRVKLERRGIPLENGKITNLQVARADVKEIKQEGEFGCMIETKGDLASGDSVYAFRIVQKQ